MYTQGCERGPMKSELFTDFDMSYVDPQADRDMVRDGTWMDYFNHLETTIPEFPFHGALTEVTNRLIRGVRCIYADGCRSVPLDVAVRQQIVGSIKVTGDVFDAIVAGGVGSRHIRELTGAMSLVFAALGRNAASADSTCC